MREGNLRTTRTTLLAVTAAIALLLPGTAVAAPEVSILDPQAGATISKSQTPVLGLSGQVSFDTPEPSDTRFYLRRTGCGTDEVRFLQTRTGADNDTCAWPQWTTLGTLDEDGFAEDFPYSDGPAFTLYGTRPITVRLVMENQIAANAGAGLATVRARLSGTTTGNQAVDFGDQSAEYTVTPTQSAYTTTFTFPPATAMDRQDFSGLNLLVSMKGIAVNHGILKLRGKSYVDMPSYSASFDRKVEIALNTGAFSATGVSVGEELSSWTASRSISALPLGANLIRARARQGGALSPVQEISISVTA